MVNRKGIFVILYFIGQSWKLSEEIYWQQQWDNRMLLSLSSVCPGLFQWCWWDLLSAAALSVYTLMFSYFTASDIFMEENLFILGTKLDLIINKLCKNNKLIINIPAEKVSPRLARPCYLVFISSPRMIVISSAGWRIIYLV